MEPLLQVVADDEATRVHVVQLSRFYLSGVEHEVCSVRISAHRVAGTPALFACHLEAHLTRGDVLIERELQADLVLAVTRLLDRSVRRLHRRNGGVRRLARGSAG